MVPASRIKTLHLFAGAGGGILADLLLGHQPIGAVEVEAYPRKVLLQRQLDGCLPEFPIWDDVRTFRSDNPDTSAYIDRLRGIRNELAISGGFPCQDISCAGKGAGITGARSGLWTHMARIICEVRPRYVFVENSPMLISRGLDVVLSDLAALGYDAKWGVVGAHHAGGNHKRDRIWIMAYASSQRWESDEHDRGSVCGQVCGSASKQGQDGECWNMDYTIGARLEGHDEDAESPERIQPVPCERGYWWATEPHVGRVVNGVASRVDRLKAIGNGQVPCVAKIAWGILNVN